MGPVTVLVAARQKTTRAACLAALAEASDVRVVAEARTAPQVLAGVRTRRPRVVVLASPLASSSDDRLLLDVLSAGRAPRVLVVAPRRSDDEVVTTLAHGARGHLEPTRVRAWLAPAVRAVARGEAWCPRALVRTLVARLRDDASAPGATPKDTVPWSNGRRGPRRRR
ncbi:MAG: hypothetical protein HYR51_14050 [Candidatus Rokubacteria bacterium]|nr:hypothetical protein [Candidatus Rokubacteria bacterium]